MKKYLLLASVAGLIIGFFGAYLLLPSLYSSKPQPVAATPTVKDPEAMKLFKNIAAYDQLKDAFIIKYIGYYPQNDSTTPPNSMILIQKETCANGCISYSIVDTKKETVVNDLFPWVCDTDCSDMIAPIAILDENKLLATITHYSTDDSIDLVVTDFNGVVIKNLLSLSEKQTAETSYSSTGMLTDVAFDIITYTDNSKREEVERAYRHIRSDDLIVRGVEYI